MSLIERLIETFIWGLFGTLFITSIGVSIFTLIKYPLYFLAFVGLILLILFVGWCILHYNNFCELFDKRKSQQNKDLPCYGNSTLDRLDKLEAKYRITTVQFMNFASKDRMPFGMDNLDYLEWISLVNDLPSITNGGD